MGAAGRRVCHSRSTVGRTWRLVWRAQYCRLKAALARPQNLAAYGKPDAAALAAAYAMAWFGTTHLLTATSELRG